MAYDATYAKRHGQPRIAKHLLSAQFRRLAARKGKKRAIVAVGHTILIIVFHMLKNKQPYRDLGADYFDRHNADQLKRALIRRLERLGLQVDIQNRISPPLKQLEAYFRGSPWPVGRYNVAQPFVCTERLGGLLKQYSHAA